MNYLAPLSVARYAGFFSVFFFLLLLDNMDAQFVQQRLTGVNKPITQWNEGFQEEKEAENSPKVAPG